MNSKKKTTLKLNKRKQIHVNKKRDKFNMFYGRADKKFNL